VNIILTIYFITMFSIAASAKIDIIGPGTYGADEFKFGKEKSIWPCLFVRNGKSEIHNATAILTEWKLPEDEVGMKVTLPQEVLFCLRGINLKIGQNIPSANIAEPFVLDPLMPPKTLSFGTLKFKIQGTISISDEAFKNNKKLLTTDDDYKIVIDIKNKSVVTDPPFTNIMVHKILWIGDLNQDGFPDILTQPYDGEIVLPKALLSSKKSSGGLFKMELVGSVPAGD
jgi:hypothetical protein